MDEPFASVDATPVPSSRTCTCAYGRASGITVVFITHDIDESVYLGDRVVVLNPAPTSVRTVLDVPLPRPRDQIRTKERPEFAQLRGRVLSEMRTARETVS